MRIQGSSAKCLLSLISRHLHSLGQIQGIAFRISRDSGTELTEHHLFVRQAASFRSEDKGDFFLRIFFQTCLDHFAGSLQVCQRRSEFPIVAGERTGKRNIF